MITSEEIWQEHYSGLRAFVKRRISDSAAADDVLQNVFLKMHVNLISLKDESRVKSWLYQIARNAIIDHYRSQKSTEEVPEWFPQPEPDPAENVMRELTDCVQPLVKLLPERYREAVTLSELQGMTQKEVARAQGISLSGAKSRVQRGRALLKTKLEDCCMAKYDSRGRLNGYEPKERGCNSC